MTTDNAAVSAQSPYPPARPRLATTLADILLAGAETFPDHTAIRLPTEALSYADLRAKAWAMAKSMAALGAGPGDTVGILMLNATEMVVAIFATAMLGATVVPINARYRANELSWIVADARLRLIITHDRHDDYVDFAALLHEALPGLAEADDSTALALPAFPELRAVLTVGKSRAGLVAGSAIASLAEQVEDARIARWCQATAIRSIAAIIYTSGTTAHPCGAMLTHEALVGHWSLVGRRWGMRPDDIFWVPVPIFHIAGIGPLVSIMAHGGTFLTDSYFDAGRGLAEIERHRATLLYPTYPPLTESLIAHPDLARRDLSSVRLWLNVAPPDVLRRMGEALPQAVQLTTYGSTEGGPVTLSSPEDSLESRINTCGLPMEDAEVAVIDATGKRVPPGTPGEIIYRGANCFSGYFANPEKTASTIRVGAWIHTGDLGRLDRKGRLQFLGRIKEMLKVGGENVAPAEVEEHLSSHPAVKLVQVVGIPDPRLVEVVAAFVELHEGMTASEEELIAFCRGRIASFKVPRLVRHVSEWPMSATKIQRGKLREALLSELGIEENP